MVPLVEHGTSLLIEVRAMLACYGSRRGPLNFRKIDGLVVVTRDNSCASS